MSATDEAKTCLNCLKPLFAHDAHVTPSEDTSVNWCKLARAWVHTRCMDRWPLSTVGRCALAGGREFNLFGTEGLAVRRGGGKKAVRRGNRSGERKGGTIARVVACEGATGVILFAPPVLPSG